MSGVEATIASEASKALASALLSPKVRDFFFTWELDTPLLDTLEIQLNSVEALLRHAEDKLFEENSKVEAWAQTARFAIYDAEDLLDGVIAEAYESNKDKLKYKVKDAARAIHPRKKAIEEELRNIIERLQSIAAQKDVLGLKEKNELASCRKRRLSSSLANNTSSIFGRSVDTRKIMCRLNSREGNDDALRVIAITGMAGIGKTTLASLVFREFKSLNQSFGLWSWLARLVRPIHNSSNLLEFDLKGWVHVSDEFDLTHVIKSLLESTGQKSTVDNSFEFLHQELSKKLQGKRFLVVVDDFWSDGIQNWDVLRTSFSVGAPGSRVIVTTRSTQVARMVTTSADFCYELDKLSRDESWYLFEKNVFPEGNSTADPRLKKIGSDIVTECNGLPLAIKMIGGLLRSKGNDETEWTSVLNSKLRNNTNIMSSLRLSYHHLPLGVRNCFAYCSIFPKDYTFSMKEMVMLWIGEGLIEKFCEDNAYEDVARTYFTHLRSIFFFQESNSGGSGFVMHNLIHDLALHVSRGLCFDFQNVTVQCRRLSYLRGKDEPLFTKISGTKLEHLRTFKPLRRDEFSSRWRGFYFKNKLLRDLLSDFKLLRVLSLEGYAIVRLPKSVGDMKLLRYLDLSRTGIDQLPDSICHLYNLRILLLSDCWKLKRLPAEICNLVNLRHLDIEGTRLEKMPDGIGRMTNIRTLSKFVVGRGKSKQIREFEEILHLHGVVHISGLNNIEDTEDVIIAGFKSKEYIEGLILDWESTRERDTELDEKVLDAIEAPKNLKTLTIKWYGGKRLSDWIVGVSPSFVDLVSLSITDCFNCEALPSLGNLPFLKYLEMRSLDRVESFGEEFYGDSHTPFPALEKLIINGMKLLKTWCFAGGDRVTFKMLNDLDIQECRELTKIPYCFPSLTRLGMGFCSNLVKLEMREAKEGSSSRRTYPRSFESIDISSCPKLEEIPNIFSNSVKFSIQDCEKLVSLPVKTARQDSYEVMEELRIKSSLSNLYSAEIHRFTSLKILELIIPVGSEDEAGDVMIRLPPNLSYLNIGGCMTPHVYAKILTETSNLKSLTKLCLYKYALESFPDVELPSTLKSLTVHQCSALRTIPDRFLSGCSQSLLELHIVNCPKLVCLPSSLLTLESLQTLHIYRCGGIHQLPTTTGCGPNYLTNLSELEISDCGALKSLPDGFHKATTLHTLQIRRCLNLCITKDRLPANLRVLSIGHCGKMKPTVETVLPTLTSLSELHLEGFPDISTLDHCIPGSIQSLTIENLTCLTSLSRVLPTLKHLRRLHVEDCPLVDQKSWS